MASETASMPPHGNPGETSPSGGGSAPLIEARGLTKRYGAGPAVLADVDFAIRPNDLLVIEGRSGSGKSTLIKLLAGLDHPTAGEVLIEGRDIAKLPDAEISAIRLRKLGIVFQAYNLLPDLTLFENVKLPGRIAGVRSPEDRARELLRLLDIESLADRRPNQVSGGQQQRAAIARALANDPVAILADEPTGNLDRKNAENVLQAFEDVNVRLGTAIVIVTHDDVILDRVRAGYVMEDGRLSARRLTPIR